MEIVLPEESPREAMQLVSEGPPQLVRAMTTETASALRVMVPSMPTTLGLHGFSKSFETAATRDAGPWSRRAHRQRPAARSSSEVVR